MIQTQRIEVRKGSAPMTLHFDDVDPVAECHITVQDQQCRWHGHGDSLRDATGMWLAHLVAAHRSDWE